MAKKSSSPSPSAGKKTDAKKIDEEIPATTKLAFGGFVAVLLFVLFIVTRESALNYATREIASKFGLKGVLVELAQGPSAPILVAKQTIYQGQPILSVSGETLLDVRTIGETPIGNLLRSDNGNLINEIGRENQLPAGAFTLMSFSAYFAAQRRLGSESKYAPFFAALPSKLNAAVFWDPSVVPCLDPAVANEFRAQLRVVNATKEALAVLCDSEAGAAAGCKGSPFTEDELAWGLAVYLQHNFQDQAFVPLLSFARFDNKKGGVSPQFERESGILNFLASANMQRGEEITLNFLRGPHVFLSAFSQFSAEQARGVELALQLPEDEAVRNLCQITELQFAPNGKPREGLVNCMTYLVAPAELRAKVLKNVRKYRTPELNAYTYGNLTVAANMMRDDKIDDEACAKVEENDVVRAAKAYNTWRRSVLDANRAFLEQQAAKMYAAAGLPLPSQEPPAPPLVQDEPNGDL